MPSSSISTSIFILCEVQGTPGTVKRAPSRVSSSIADDGPPLAPRPAHGCLVLGSLQFGRSPVSLTHQGSVVSHKLPDTCDDLAAIQLDLGDEGFVGQAASAVLHVKAGRAQRAQGAFTQCQQSARARTRLRAGSWGSGRGVDALDSTRIAIMF